MQIDAYLRKELVKEIRYCAKKIVEEEDLERKMFFYAYAYSAADRVLEFSYEPQLLFIEFILEISQGTISKRVKDICTGKDKTIPLMEGFFDRVAGNLDELATKIEKDEDTYKTLEKIVESTYLATSDGYYQYAKGVIQP